MGFIKLRAVNKNGSVVATTKAPLPKQGRCIGKEKGRYYFLNLSRAT